MSIAIVGTPVDGGATSGNTSSGTVTYANTTGANKLIVVVNSGTTNAITVADSQGGSANTGWTSTTAVISGTYQSQIWYCDNPTHTGTTHTFTATSTGGFLSMAVFAVSGAATGVDKVSAGAGTAGATTLTPTAVTPTNNGSLLISGIGASGSAPTDGTSTYTAVTVANLASNHIGGGGGYFLQATAGSTAPTWTWTTSSAGASSLVAFAPAATGPATGYTVSSPSPIYGQVGRPAAYVATPNGTYSSTITLKPTGAGLSSPANDITQTWAGDSSSKSFSFAPTSAGTLTIAVSNGGGITDPGAPSSYTAKLLTEITTNGFAYANAPGTLCAQLHDGSIDYDPATGLFWFCGEDFSGTQSGTGGSADYACTGVHAYSSTDLINWTDQGLVVTPTIGGTTYAYTSRPHWWRDGNGTWYMAIHVDQTSFTLSYVVLLTATSPLGPWSVKIAAGRPGGVLSRDIGLLVDGADVYLYFANSTTGNGTTASSMHVSKLSADRVSWGTPQNIYCSTGFIGTGLAEAPAPFRIGPTYYLLASQQNGWTFSENELYSASSPMTTNWTLQSTVPWVTSAAGPSSSYGSQSGNVYRTPAGQLILMSDAWNTNARNDSTQQGLAWSGAMWLPINVDLAGNVAFDYVSHWTPIGGGPSTCISTRRRYARL